MQTIYAFFGGPLSGRVMTRGIANKFADGNTGSMAKERARGALVRRVELDDQPTVNGYLGPMWDGIRYEINGQLRYEFETTPEEREGREPIAVLRYETQEVYNMLSR